VVAPLLLIEATRVPGAIKICCVAVTVASWALALLVLSSRRVAVLRSSQQRGLIETADLFLTLLFVVLCLLWPIAAVAILLGWI
jgi:hypothetical protein